jgi:hypothetical protein
MTRVGREISQAGFGLLWVTRRIPMVDADASTAKGKPSQVQLLLRGDAFSLVPLSRSFRRREMITQESKSKTNAASVLRSARALRSLLGDENSQVSVKVTGGSGVGRYADADVTAIPCVTTVNSTNRDAANAFFNENVAEGCDCTQPAEDSEGNWSSTCTCPDE